MYKSSSNLKFVKGESYDSTLSSRESKGETQILFDVLEFKMILGGFDRKDYLVLRPLINYYESDWILSGLFYFSKLIDLTSERYTPFPLKESKNTCLVI